MIALIFTGLVENGCAGFSDYIDDLGGGYYFESESGSYNSIFRGKAIDWSAYSIDTCLLAMNIKVLDYDKQYIYISKKRIVLLTDFELAAGRLNYSAIQLDSFKLSEEAKQCEPCYYIIIKGNGKVSSSMNEERYLRARNSL